jgi:fibronectin-binding autotransporter adhesin
MNANQNSLRLAAESTHRTSPRATPDRASAGRRFGFVVWFVALLLALGFHSAVAQPVAIAHWTFDASSLTIDGGNITTFADATGNRNAYVTPNPLGPNNRISAPFTTADSVAGKFGEAVRFNGDNFLVFSNLVELMQASGNPSYSISMWVRWLNPTAPVGNTCYRTMSDWGNQTPGTANVNSDHVYGFGPNGATTIRGQTRRPGPGAGGVDIYARNATATVTDGEWHMLTWTFNTTTGELNTYFDGALIDTFTASSPFTMADSVSPLGAFGIKADDAAAPFLEADTQLDEVWVILGVLSADDVAQLHDVNAIIPLGRNVTWQGGANSNWDTTSENWLTNAGPATSFETGDVALFNDTSSANNVNLTTALLPWSVTVNNDTAVYSFTGSGRLATAADGLTKQGPGTLTIANSGNNSFPQVTISGGVLQVGNGGSAGDLGAGNILNNASLVVNRTGSLTLNGNISGTGTVTKTGAGNLLLNGANSHSGTTLVTGGTLTLGAGASLSASTPVAIANSSFDIAAVTPLTLSGGQALNLTNATIRVGLADATDAVTTPALAVSGTVTVNVATMPELLTYPQQFTAIKYTTRQGTATYQLGTLPATLSVPYQGYLSNNVANNSIDVVITSGPAALFWAGYAGGLNSSWNLATANWKTEAGAFTTYSDGLPATFNDAASNSTVTLDVVVSPTSLAVNNSVLNYTFNGASHISGSGALTKDGSGSLLLNNSGVNDFTGGVVINAGTVRIGNNDTAGNLPTTGTVANNGALIFARADDVTVPNVISGSGSISQTTASALTLSGANTAFTGPVTVSQGTLRTGNGAALGTADGATTIASGATLDVSGQILNVEPVIVSGTGVNGFGAIVNSGAGQINALRNVTLTGHTTFGGDNRWDIRLGGGIGQLSTGGNAYNITKIGASQVSLVNLAVDAALGNIDIQSGRFALEGTSTSLGNPAATMTIRVGSIFSLFNATNQLNKVIVSEEGSTIHNDSGVNTIVGPITLSSAGGFHTFQSDAGTTLNLQSTLTGGGLIYKTAGTGLLNITGNSPGFTGGIYIGDGTVTLSGSLNNVVGITLAVGRFNVNGTLLGAGVTSFAGSTLAGSGSISGAVDVGGAIIPGDTAIAGTLTTGNLNLQAGVGVTFDLASVTTVGGGINDLIAVNGDLTMNGNDITINAIGATGLTAGTYRLITYTGGFVGTIGTASLPGGAGRYLLTLSHNVGTKSIDLIVTGNSHTLEWNNASASATWDLNVSQNWSNRTTSAAMDYFFASDEVLFTDSIITAPNSTTTVALSGAVSPSLTTVNSTTNYTITGPGGISGGGGVVKQGSSTLTIASTNNFTGAVAVQAGTVRVANNGALGLVPGGAVTVSAGATLDVGGNPTANNANYGAKQIFVAGTGVGGNGAIINSGTVAQQNSFQRVTLTGDTTFGGPGDAAATGNPGRWDIRGGTPTLDLGGFTLTKIGANQVTFVGVAISGGNIIVNNGIVAAETTTSFTGGGTITVNSGGTLGHFRNNAGLFNRPITLNGGIIRNLATSGAATVNSSPITLVADSTLQGSTTAGYPITFTNVISQSGGSYGITKTGAGAVILTANHTYSGATRINTGAIQLVDSGNLPNSSLINIASGASLNVAARTDGTLTLNSGQTLAGNGTVTGNLVVGNGAIVSPGVSSAGTLIVASNVTFQAGSTAFMELNKAPVENDQVRATAGTATTITYGGTLQLSLLGGALAAGDSFRLFVATNYVGSFSSIIPATPGAGLVWDTTGLTNGTLRVAAPPAPSISGLTFSGGNVVISGTGGTPNAEYRVLTTTDLTLPLANWTPIFTNTFDALGNFSYTNGAPTGAQRFYTVFEP